MVSAIGQLWPRSLPSERALATAGRPRRTAAAVRDERRSPCKSMERSILTRRSATVPHATSSLMPVRASWPASTRPSRGQDGRRRPSSPKQSEDRTGRLPHSVYSSPVDAAQGHLRFHTGKQHTFAPVVELVPLVDVDPLPVRSSRLGVSSAMPTHPASYGGC